MVGMSPIGSYVGGLTLKDRSVCSCWSTGGGCCTWLFHIKQNHFIQQHPFLSSNIQHSTFHHLANQTIRQSDIRPEACGASFQTKKLRTFACFPLIKECSIPPLQSGRLCTASSRRLAEQGQSLVLADMYPLSWTHKSKY